MINTGLLFVRHYWGLLAYTDVQIQNFVDLSLQLKYLYTFTYIMTLVGDILGVSHLFLAEFKYHRRSSKVTLHELKEDKILNYQTYF